jgi:hypothetical protein
MFNEINFLLDNIRFLKQESFFYHWYQNDAIWEQLFLSLLYSQYQSYRSITNYVNTKLLTSQKEIIGVIGSLIQ